MKKHMSTQLFYFKRRSFYGFTLLMCIAAICFNLQDIAKAQQLPTIPPCPSDYIGQPVCDAFEQLNALNDPNVLNDLIDLQSELYSQAEEEIKKRVEQAANDIRIGPAVNFFNQSAQAIQPILTLQMNF